LGCNAANFENRYGIEGIAQTYEDPFGVAKIDINMDDIVEDARREVEVLLSCWQTQGNSGEIFRNSLGETSTSEESSVYFDDDATNHGHAGSQSAVRFVISDLSLESAKNEGRGRMLSAISPGTVESPSSGDYFAAEEGHAGEFDFRREGVVAPGISPLRNVM
jgi:putative membrane protein